MNADRSRYSWERRRKAQWPMPVCLQPRAPRHVRILCADDKRPVRQSCCGNHLRPNGDYQLEVALPAESVSPVSVTFVAGPVRRTSDQEQRISQDGLTLYRYDFRLAQQDDGLRQMHCFWSRLEGMVVRLEYGDGRDDYEHSLWLVITPRRAWALLAILSSVILYGVVPWLSKMVLDKGNLPAAWSAVLEVAKSSAVWEWLVLVVLALWGAVLVTDGLQRWVRWLRLRATVRQQISEVLDSLDLL